MPKLQYFYLCNEIFLFLRLVSTVSCSAVSNSLQPHELQHARLPCPSPTPRACSNSRPSSPWCHPTICRPLLLPPSIFPSSRVFSNESVLCIRWPKYWTLASASVYWYIYTGVSSDHINLNIKVYWFPKSLTWLFFYASVSNFIGYSNKQSSSVKADSILQFLSENVDQKPKLRLWSGHLYLSQTSCITFGL